MCFSEWGTRRAGWRNWAKVADHGPPPESVRLAPADITAGASSDYCLLEVSRIASTNSSVCVFTISCTAR